MYEINCGNVIQPKTVCYHLTQLVTTSYYQNTTFHDQSTPCYDLARPIPT